MWAPSWSDAQPAPARRRRPAFRSRIGAERTGRRVLVEERKHGPIESHRFVAGLALQVSDGDPTGKACFVSRRRCDVNVPIVDVAFLGLLFANNERRPFGDRNGAGGRRRHLGRVFTQDAAVVTRPAQRRDRSSVSMPRNHENQPGPLLCALAEPSSKLSADDHGSPTIECPSDKGRTIAHAECPSTSAPFAVEVGKRAGTVYG